MRTHTIPGNFIRSHPLSFEAPTQGSSSTSSKNQPGTHQAPFVKEDWASGSEEESSGQWEGEWWEEGGGTGRGRIRRTGLTSDWLECWAQSQLQSASRSCPTFQQLRDQNSGALDRSGGYPLALLLFPRLALLTIPALTAQPAPKGRKEGPTAGETPHRAS